MATKDGNFLVVGKSVVDELDEGNWKGIKGYGSDDAIVVKYDNNGNIIWQQNFGGEDRDEYMSIATETIPDFV